jgi:hypothetical protein
MAEKEKELEQKAGYNQHASLLDYFTCFSYVF